MKCSAMERTMEKTSHPFVQMGSVSSDSFSERLFIALNISIVTSTDKDMVVAFCDIQLLNMSQPNSGNWVLHTWKLH